MSKQVNRELSSWKVVLQDVRRDDIRWRGLPLSSRDHLTYTEAILCWGMVASDVNLQCDEFGTTTDYKSWLHKVASLDVSDVARSLSDLIVLLRSASAPSNEGLGRFLDRFKHDEVTEIICEPIVGILIGYHERRTPELFSLAYQFFAFPLHLTLLDLDTRQELEEEYLRTEREVRSHHLNDRLVKEMNVVMRRWLKDLVVDESNFIPKHGPGAVAELVNDRSLLSKYRSMRIDQLLEVALSFSAGIDARTFLPEIDPTPLDRRSVVVFVPKSMKTKRVISKEPASLMYFQQAVQAITKDFVDRHPYLSTKVNFFDQSPQQGRALDASRTREYATVDLSAASDRMSYELVKRVFTGTPLYPFLIALRSKISVLPSGKAVELAKYAPMGSAFTFPIQTLIFASICECTMDYVHATTGKYDFSYGVYGDDIIIPDCGLHDLVVNLRWCGFRINEDKTFGGSHKFRESCGCEAFDGVDVSPMRISRRFAARKITSHTPGVFAGRCDMANLALSHHLPMLRRYLVHELVTGSNFRPLFSEDGRKGVLSSQPTNYHLPHSWNGDYQAEEVLHGAVSSTVSSGSPRHEQCPGNFSRGSEHKTDCECDDSDSIRLFEWLRSTSNRTGDPHDPASRVVTHIGSPKTSLVISKTILS